MWRYAVGRGDDDPARAAFVEQVEARLRAEATAERRREAAKKATEALRAKLRAAGIDPHTYYSMLAQRGNAARWRKQDAPPASEARGDGAQTEAGPPASEGAARVKECAPGPQQAEAAERGAQTSDNLPRRTCRARISHTRRSSNPSGFTAPSKPDPRIAGLGCRQAVLPIPPAAFPPHPTM